jgi:hypothetical protein
MKFADECDLIFNLPAPKYTESAPALIAAARDSHEPDGAQISTFWGSLYFFFISEIFCKYINEEIYLKNLKNQNESSKYIFKIRPQEQKDFPRVDKG